MEDICWRCLGLRLYNDIGFWVGWTLLTRSHRCRSGVWDLGILDVPISYSIYIETLQILVRLYRCTKMIWNYIETLKTSVRLWKCTKMIWNCVKTAGLVSLHVVFWNWVAPIITSGKTTWGYRELRVSRKLEHGPRHYNCHPSKARVPTIEILKVAEGW